MSYDSINDLVINSFITEGKMPSFESLTQKVLEHFPNSAWQKSHYSWYKSQINTGRIEISMSIKEDSDSSDDLIEESITLMFSPDSVSPDSLQIRKLSAP